MNCGNIKCAYECVQRDKEIEKQKTQRIQGIVYGIRDFANPKIDANTRRKALDILEKVLKKERII